MKNKLMVSAVLAMTVLASATHADDYVEAKKGTAFLSGAISGEVLGGPVGMFVGALTGAYVGDKIEDASEYDVVTDLLAANKAELKQSYQENQQLQRSLTMVTNSNKQYAQLVMEQLEFEMLFKTNQSELSDSGLRRLQSLGDFLANNPGIVIRLDGYSDPRGDAEYNRQLSQQRLSSVENILALSGVDNARIDTLNHGASQSQASKGDIDAYALERKVTVQLSTEGKAHDSVAVVN